MKEKERGTRDASLRNTTSDQSYKTGRQGEVVRQQTLQTAPLLCCKTSALERITVSSASAGDAAAAAATLQETLTRA